MNDVSITVIGAGVVGLSVARKISSLYDNVIVLEKHNTFGQETSSRNSEVIHAGIYYPNGSLKSILCVKGRIQLYEYCEKNDIPHKRCGKLIVATTPDEVDTIEGVIRTASSNGVNDLVMLDSDAISELEPSVFALRAIYSPSTGIIDSHSLMKQYEADTINSGGQIAYSSEVVNIKKTTEGYEISVTEPDGNIYTFTSRIVINSGGLTADRISEMAGIIDDSLKITFCKGEYFRINPPKNRLLKRLVYPVPHPRLEHIGVHVTIDLAGGARLGPDVTYLGSNNQDYRLTPSKQSAFFHSAGKYLPFLEYDDLSPEMAGIRPKLQKAGEAFRDFYIREESDRGYPGFINLIGMESPALTSSLAIADHVERLLAGIS